MQVRATRPGFYGATFHAQGDVFEVPDSLRGSWFVPTNLADMEAVSVGGGGSGERGGEGSGERGGGDLGRLRQGKPSAGLRKPSEAPAPKPKDPGSP